jgi:hypothetical protein
MSMESVVEKASASNIQGYQDIANTGTLITTDIWDPSKRPRCAFTGLLSTVTRFS